MNTILIANRKGGCGKTTAAVTIASALATRGGRVALADADPQKSATRWLKRRPASAAPIARLDWSSPKSLGEVPKGIDWVVIDGPGALDTDEAQALIAEASAVIAPLQPSVFDADSTRRFLKGIAEIKRIRKGKVGLEVIVTRVKPRSRAAQRINAFLEEIGQHPRAWISDRAAYGDLAEDGLSVFDMPALWYRPLRQQWEPMLRALA